MNAKLDVRSVVMMVAIAALPASAIAQSYPRTLTVDAEASVSYAKLSATFTVQVDRLMRDQDFMKVADALKFGGYPRFLPALRQLPAVGRLLIGDMKFELRYARERATDKHLVLVADRPVYFFGGGSVDPKAKGGYELTILELDLDPSGNGKGTMAAAARVKPSGDGGVIVDDYGLTPFRLTVKPGK